MIYKEIKVHLLADDFFVYFPTAINSLEAIKNMITSENEFLSFMDTNHFVYQRMEHPAVFTCAEADAHHSDITAVSTKNLFLCDKKGCRFFLVVTACTKL